MRRKRLPIETRVIRIQESGRNRALADEEISQIGQRVRAELPSWRKEVMEFARAYSVGLATEPDTELELSRHKKERLKQWGEALQYTSDDRLDTLSRIMDKSDVEEEMKLGILNENEVWAALAATRVLRVFVGKYLEYATGAGVGADGTYVRLHEMEYSETQKKLAGWSMELTETYGRAMGKYLMANITRHTEEVIETVMGKRSQMGNGPN